MGRPITRLGLITVEDHYAGGSLDETHISINDNAVVFRGVTENLEEFQYWLQTETLVSGGSDAAECFDCGVKMARAIMPNATIWVVTDSYPHRKIAYFGYELDSIWDGCPMTGIRESMMGVNVLVIKDAGGHETPPEDLLALAWGEAQVLTTTLEQLTERISERLPALVN